MMGIKGWSQATHPCPRTAAPWRPPAASERGPRGF